MSRHRRRRLSPERIAEIQALCDLYDDLPTGAWLAVLEEHGVSVDDLAKMPDSVPVDRKKVQP